LTIFPPLLTVVAPIFAPLLAVITPFFAAFHPWSLRRALRNGEDRGWQRHAYERKHCSTRNLFDHLRTSLLSWQRQRSMGSRHLGDVDLDQARFLSSETDIASGAQDQADILVHPI
jgi:hypothetical protein